MTSLNDLPPIVPGLVSVVIPMRNAAAYIRQALDSVLTHPRTPLEVIVVNDGSIDGSDEVVRSIRDGRVRLIDGPGEGNISSTLNAGLAHARGEWFMRCDADDAFEPGRVDWQACWLAGHPQFAAVCGTFCTVDPNGRELAPMNRQAQAEEITAEMRAGHTRTHLGTFAVRMAVARKLGGFRNYFSGVEDVDFQLRVASVGRVWFEPRLCYRYRLHPHSITHREVSARREFLTETARRFAVQRRDRGTDDLERGQPPPIPAESGAADNVNVQMQQILIGQAWREHRQGRRVKAICTGWRAGRMRPVSLRPWRALVLLCLKPVPRSD